MTDLFHLNPFQQLGRLEQSLDRLSEAIACVKGNCNLWNYANGEWDSEIKVELTKAEAIVAANFERLEESLNQYKAALLGPMLSKMIEEQDIAKELIPEKPEKLK